MKINSMRVINPEDKSQFEEVTDVRAVDIISDTKYGTKFKKGELVEIVSNLGNVMLVTKEGKYGNNVPCQIYDYDTTPVYKIPALCAYLDDVTVEVYTDMFRNTYTLISSDKEDVCACGISTCCADDKFDLNAGIMLSTIRAQKEMLALMEGMIVSKL